MSQFVNREVNVFIEIPKNSHIKYEFDKETNTLKCDRILHTPFNYFFNYGFVPKTLSLDGDPIDVIVVMEDELIPGCSIECKILGCLETSDDKGDDPKLIVCPTSRIDLNYENINSISDVPEHTLTKIVYFFSHYKDLENKKVHIGTILDSDDAVSILNDSIARYNSTMSTPPSTPVTLPNLILNSDGFSI